MSPQDCLWAAPLGNPSGSGHILPYIHPLVLIRIHYVHGETFIKLVAVFGTIIFFFGNTVDVIEKTAIDFDVMSSDLVKHIESIHIDEESVYVLTKNLKKKSKEEYTESDHNIIREAAL